MIISFIVAVLVIIADQLTKYLIYGTEPVSIIGNLIWFQSTLNTGVAFSMFENMIVFFSLVSFIASGIFIYLIISNRFLKYKAEKITLGFILGGTVGNLIDRLIFGGVRDFIYLKFINFAIFNIADMAISIGAAVFCIIFLVIEIKNNKKDTKIANTDKNSDDNTENLNSDSDMGEK